MIEANQYKTASTIVRLGNAVTYFRNVRMQEYGLTSAQGDVIRAILHEPGITAAELRKKLGLSPVHRGRDPRAARTQGAAGKDAGGRRRPGK